tara:strand:+ start:165 stop:416 length:252 start_codon:yes stop_codon:yes gene_type:complete
MGFTNKEKSTLKNMSMEMLVAIRIIKDGDIKLSKIMEKYGEDKFAKMINKHLDKNSGMHEINEEYQDLVAEIFPVETVFIDNF